MKTLRKTAEEAYLKYANKIINRETWIDGFISGIQYKKEYPQSIELLRLLLVLVAELRRQQPRGQPLLLLGRRLPAVQQQSRLRLQRALCTKQIIYI